MRRSAQQRLTGLGCGFVAVAASGAARISLIASLLAAAVAPLARGGQAAVMVKPVAVTGTPADGMPDGVLFWLFTTALNHSIMHPVIDEQGQLAFTGRVTGPGVDASNRNALWMEQGEELALIVRSGTPAPGMPAGVVFAGFSSDYIPVPPRAAEGNVAFQAELSGPGIDFTNGSGVWKQSGEEILFVARLGDPAAGFGPGVRYSSFIALGGFNVDGHALLAGSVFGPGVTTANNSAFWSDRSGALQLILREGDAAPGLPGFVFAHGQLGATAHPFGLSAFNGQSRLAVQANLNGPSINYFNDETLYAETDAGLTLVVREGQPAPGMPNGVTFGGNSVTTLQTLSMSFNDNGRIAFTCNLGGSMPTTFAMFSDHTGALLPVIVPGQPAPGVGYNWGIFGGPVLNNQNKIAFRASVPNNNPDPFTPPQFAIWSDRAGSLAPIVHPGDIVVGQEGAEIIGTSFVVGFNEAGLIAFTAGIDHPRDGYKSGLFLGALDGTNHLVVATSDLFDVFGDGSALRTVQRIVHGGLSETGEVAFRLDFTDQSSGHYTAHLGIVAPCPADISPTSGGGDGVVNVNDLLLVIANWGATGPPANAADVNGDNVVDVNDLLAVIGAWGPCG